MTQEATTFRDLRVELLESLNPHDRILKTAIQLFNEFGVHTVGIDRIIAESGVAKRTFYKYFPSKADLVSAFLDFRSELQFNCLAKHVAKAKGDPRGELLAIFDNLEEWFSEKDFNGCAFARGLNDFADDDSEALRTQVRKYFGQWDSFIEPRLAAIMKPARAKLVLPQILSLITGATIVAHASGNPKVAHLNKSIAKYLLDD
jgi:AcrR family transcriptional regulator